MDETAAARSTNRGRYVSTGAPAAVRRWCRRSSPRRTSATAPRRAAERTRSVYPALARVPADLFGICVVAHERAACAATGDAECAFTIMSVSKPFVFALVCEALGPEEARRRLGVNATGLPFNSLGAVEQSPDGRTNPMVNAGRDRGDEPRARARRAEERWQTFIATASRASPAARSRSTTEVYASASETNHRNQGIARLLQSLRPDLRSTRPRRPTSTRGSAACASPRATSR